MGDPQFANDLEFTGRKGNAALGNFRLIGKSKHQQYFTSNELSSAICEMLKPVMGEYKPEGFSVLDPTCGSGRLLLPWKKAGAQVIGIELDKETAAVARRLLGKKSVRTGDILDYSEYLDGFNVAVTNPPYGIWWNVEGKKLDFESECYGGSVESQSATLEICTNALTWGGILAAVIPSTTFTNPKDKGVRNHIYGNYRVLLKATMKNAFRKEYNIAVSVDVVVCIKEDGDGEEQGCKTLELDVLNDPNWKQILCGCMRQILDDREIRLYPSSHGVVPFLDTLVSLPVTNCVNITPKGVAGDLSAVAQLDFLNDVMSAYNPIQGIETGIADAYFSPCTLLRRGVNVAIEMLSCLGFDPVIKEKDMEKIERLRVKYDFLSTPLYSPKPHQLLAYYFDKEYEAECSVKDEKGKILFRKGKSYHLHPTWVRRKETVNIATVYDESKRKNITLRTEVDRGYLAIRVKTERGEKSFQEIDVEEIKLLTTAFPPPKIEDIADRHPEKVERYRRLIAEKAPFLFDYQQEDLARLALKPFGFIGYEMGGGKTVSSAAWAMVKGFKTVLVVCQSGLVMNWMNELKKFGFKAKKLNTHTSIDRFKESLKNSNDEAVYYVTSYEFLSLDTGRKYDPWECIEYDADGNVRRSATDITSGKCPLCHKSFENVVRKCPKCDESEGWTGAFCRKCGYRAYTYTSERKMYPAYKRILKLFDCIIVDEAQLAKTKNSGRGRAVRALKGKGKLILTGTLMKGFVTDIFWNVGWLLGFGNPLFPYHYRGGSKLFLDEFGTYEYVTKQFEDTLSEGRARLIPEVSNLNRLWRLMGSFTIRRLKDEMIELPEKRKHILLLSMDEQHAEVYNAYQEWASTKISFALRAASKNGGEVNMGIISAALWKLRFAATVPNAKDYLCDGTGPDVALFNGHRWNKVRKIVELASEMKRKKEKVVIFSGLRPMVSAIAKAFQQERIGFIPIIATHKAEQRFDLIQKFGSDDCVTAIVAGLNVLNRGFTITSASNVIITDIEYSPESVLQAEDRVHRTGQEKEVDVYYLFSQDSIDEVMFELVSKKQAAISNAIDGKAVYKDVAELLESSSNIQMEVAKRVMKANPVIVEVVKAPVVEKLPVEMAAFEKPQSAFVWPDIDLTPRRKRVTPDNPNQLLLFADA